MADPSVSVIIATYNWSAVLPYSIGSALRQTRSDLEVLVVGDGCTDDSEEVVAAIHDPRVRWINLPANSGHQFGPNNEGLRQARGQYIAYLGHDDLWLPHHLECLVALLESGNDFANGIIKLVKPDSGDENKAFDLNNVPLIIDEYQPGLWIPPTAMVHRRSVTEAIGGWRSPAELTIDPETDLLKRAHDAGCQFGFARRLTAVKFPAVWRHKVYQTRPCHEQSAWLRRIETEPDLELTELAELAILAERSRHPKAYRALCANLLSETQIRIASRLSKLRKWPQPTENGAIIKNHRRAKGLI